jgi:hypothetical protein
MKRFAALVLLGVLASAANAAPVNLVCKVSNGAGQTKEYEISFDESQNWATEGFMKMKGGVTPQRISTLVGEVNRMTGEFVSTDKSFTGPCEKAPVGKF